MYLLKRDFEKGEISSYFEKAHDGIINCINSASDVWCYNGAPEFVTGGRDGKVKVWDVRQKNYPVASIASDNYLSRECWSVAFGNCVDTLKRVIAAGFDNGDLKLIDLRNSKVLWEQNLSNGICSIEFDRKNTHMNKMTVTTLEGGLYSFNMKNCFRPSNDSVSHRPSVDILAPANKIGLNYKSTVWLVKHLPQKCNNFITASGEGRLQLWQYDCTYTNSLDDERPENNIKLLNSTVVSSQPIICFDWSHNFEGLAVCGSIDQSIRIILITNQNFE